MPFLKSLVRLFVCGTSKKAAVDDEQSPPVRQIPVHQVNPSSWDVISQQRLSTTSIPPRPPTKDWTPKHERREDPHVPSGRHKQDYPTSIYQYPPFPANAPPIVQVVQGPRHISPRIPVAVRPGESRQVSSRTPPSSRPQTPARHPSLTRSASQNSRSPTPLSTRTVVQIKTVTPSAAPSQLSRTPSTTVRRARSPSEPPPLRRQRTIERVPVELPPIPPKQVEQFIFTKARPKTPEPQPAPLRRASSQKSISRSASPLPYPPVPVPVSIPGPRPITPTPAPERSQSPPPPPTKSRVRSPSAPPPLRRQKTFQAESPELVPQVPPAKPVKTTEDDPVYTLLRSAARTEGDAMRQCFDDSQAAFKAGKKALAKDLSDKGKAHRTEMEKLDKEAAEYVFRLNNVDCGPDEIDLHGLFVKEAVDMADQALVAAKQRGATHLRLIVGKGLHSAGAVAKVKPAIEGLMVKHRLSAALDPRNAGVLVVSMAKFQPPKLQGPSSIPNRRPVAVV